MNTVKFKIILLGIILIFPVSSVFADNEDYLHALEKTIRAVNASVEATVKSIEEAVDMEAEQQATMDSDAVERYIEPQIVRAVFTTGIRDNEPVNELDVLSEQKKLLFFFTELHGMKNRKLEQRWIYEGQEQTVAAITPDRGYWTGVSRMALRDRYGQWVFEIFDEAGNLMIQKKLSYQAH